MPFGDDEGTDGVTVAGGTAAPNDNDFFNINNKCLIHVYLYNPVIVFVALK
jgi:hypothetical protein